MSRSAGPKWQFAFRFRKGAFGWRGSSAAVERIAQAVAEIKGAALADPSSAAEGAIRFIERLSPALEHVDSSSGALGSAVNWAIAELVPPIASAPVDEKTRRRWLDRLWEAFMADEIPSIEQLGDFWGELCATPQIAAEWAARLAPEVIDSYRRDGRPGSRYFHGTMACFSALMAAHAYDEILALIERNPRPWWHERRWGFQALLAQGRRSEALRYAEASRDATGNEAIPIAQACEALLLESGMHEEAYNRYAIEASGLAHTNLARFRELVKKYPAKLPARILHDLIATTPGREGKWFAAAKSAGLFDEAIELARSTPSDPKTLGRAARDFKDERPAFARDAALLALRRFAEGYGYEVTSFDVIDAYRNGLAAAERLNEVNEYIAQADAIAAAGGAFIRDALRWVIKPVERDPKG